MTPALVTAELWAAMALADGGGTTEWTIQGVCERYRVRYYAPRFDWATLDHGKGIYHTLGWLIANSDSWKHGRKPPLEIPSRTAEGGLADDERSRVLAAQVDEARAAAAAEIAQQRRR